MTRYDAIVLTGGRGRRLGGVDKATVEIGGRSLLDRVLLATRSASRLVVVGPERELPSWLSSGDVQQVQETPAGGGPVAALAAALPLIRADHVAVLACDLPLIDEESLAGLLHQLVTPPSGSAGDEGVEGVVFVDEAGRRQPLCAVYETHALRRAVSSLEAVIGAAMRDVIRRLRVSETAAENHQALDCDDWDDVAVATRIVESR